jgi:hypothetical protein
VIVPPFFARVEGGRPPIRRGLDLIEAAGRYRTAAARALPDYVIIGAARSGTSFLARRLRRHPDVIPSFTTSEVHYFDLFHDRGERWYRMHFPRRSTLQRLSAKNGRRVICGEKTPNYLQLGWVPAELEQMCPDVRLVVLLREPLDRAWSSYRMRERKGTIQPPFAAIVAAEAAVRAAEPDRPDDQIVVDGYLAPRYLRAADYAAQLRPWRDRFGAQVRVWKAEDLYADPQAVYVQVLEHLGLDPAVAPRVGPGSTEWASASPAPAELRAELGPYFEPLREAVAREVGIRWE